MSLGRLLRAGLLSVLVVSATTGPGSAADTVSGSAPARPAAAVAAAPLAGADAVVTTRTTATSAVADAAGGTSVALPLTRGAGSTTPGVRAPRTAAAEEQVMTADGAWCWFGDPRAVRHKGRHDRTYLGWLTRTGEIQVGAYEHATKAFTTATLMDRFQVDDHNNPSVVVRPDGRLMVFWSAHAGRDMFYRTSTRAEDITSWGPTMTLPVQLAGQVGYTYPNPVFVPSEGGRLYLFWRAWYQPTVSWSDDGGKTWAPARQVLANGRHRPYVKVALGPDGALHLAFTDAHPASTDVNDVHYGVLRKGVLYRSDGSRIGALADGPLSPDAFETVYSQRQHGAKAWIHDIAVRPDGRPAVVLATFPSVLDHRYRYAWIGADGVWRSTELTNAGPSFVKDGLEQYYSGGIALDHEDPSTVYLSRKDGLTWEIERWRTPDGGRTWTHTAVTSRSTLPNVRPVSPRGSAGGALDVVWMAGDYAHYNTYATGIAGPSDGRQVLRADLTGPATAASGGEVSLTGTLRDADTGAVLPGAPVTLWSRRAGGREPFVQQSAARTDTAGRVTWPVTLSTQTEYEMRSAGSGTRSPAWSHRVVVHPAPLPTALRARVTPAVVRAGTVVQVTARVLRRSDGQPASNAVVEVFAEDRAGVLRGVRRVTSAADGLVTVPHRPQATTRYVVRVLADRRHLPSEVATTATVVRAPLASTKVRVSVAPGSVRAGQQATVSARLVRVSDGAVVARQPVEVRARRAGSSSWVTLARPVTSPNGRVVVAHRPNGDTVYAVAFAGSPYWAAATGTRTLRLAR